jgi:signal transduction histidine kinase
MSEVEKQNLESPETALPVKIVEIINPTTYTGKQIKAEGITAHIKIPLIAQNKLIGFFNLGAKQKDTFTEEYIAIAQEISTSLAIGLQQARFFLLERHQREQAEALREIGEALNATLNFDEILNLLLGQVSRALPYDSANIILIEGDNAKIHYASGYERYGEEVVKKISNLSFLISETPNLQWIIKNQEPLIIPDIHQYEGWRKDKGITQTRSWVGVPIFVNGTISVLFALSKQQLNYYDESHVNTLRAFASQVGLALENARLYEKQRAYANELEDRVKVRTRALADANERLKELDRLKTKFISDVSHELRTPITNVGIYLDLLERGQAHKQQQYMNILKQETRRLSQLIEDIFDESQYASHLRQANYDLVDINVIIYRSIGLHQREAVESNLVLTYDLQANLSFIWGESLQLTQVISNLLKNAISYMTKGEICISTHQKEGMIMVSVDDTGVGISPEDLPHLFERFYRGKNASQSTIPGTGLGLGVVREIIELHGGTITASNNASGGASFHIILPVTSTVETQLLTGQRHQPQIGNTSYF